MLGQFEKSFKEIERLKAELTEIREIRQFFKAAEKSTADYGTRVTLWLSLKDMIRGQLALLESLERRISPTEWTQSGWAEMRSATEAYLTRVEDRLNAVQLAQQYEIALLNAQIAQRGVIAARWGAGVAAFGALISAISIYQGQAQREMVVSIGRPLEISPISISKDSLKPVLEVLAVLGPANSEVSMREEDASVRTDVSDDPVKPLDPASDCSVQPSTGSCAP